MKPFLLTLLLGGCAAAATVHFTGTALTQPAPDFTLTSSAGRPWTLSRQHGKVIALMFGYTHCTDTCPDTLAKLGVALRKAGGTPRDAQVVFVSIDPKRDTPARMHAWLQRFSPESDFVGLTGTPAQIAAVENAYHVYAKIDAKDNVVHSEFTYLIDRNGEERVVHDDADSQAAFASDIRTLLQ